MIYKLLSTLRKNRNLSREQLAERMHYSLKTIVSAEQGKMITPSLLASYNRYFRRDIPDDMNLICELCKEPFVSQNGLQLFCPECSKKVKTCGRGFKRKKEHQYNPNPITRDTIMIICMYHMEGQTTKQIAKLLNRPEDVVWKLLRHSIKNGTYLKYKNLKETAVVDFAELQPKLATYKHKKIMSIPEDNEE